jgi:hypothetical protein
LTRDFAYDTVAGEHIRIASGFEWNGANIPILLWPVVGDPFSPATEYAVLLHDYLCGIAVDRVTRLYADNIFQEVLVLQKRVCAPRRWMLYRGVRIGAWWKYGSGVSRAR